MATFELRYELEVVLRPVATEVARLVDPSNEVP
jgi:hypothetical protein